MDNPIRLIDWLKREKIIEEDIKKNDDIVYGARAMNAQLPPFYRRETRDWDVLTPNPHKRAKQVEKKLDNMSGNFFYVKKAIYPKTWKVMDVGEDNRKNTRDDFSVVDFTTLYQIKTKKINGIRYAHLSERIKDAKKALGSKAFKFRAKKDKNDLYNIQQGRKFKKMFGW